VCDCVCVYRKPVCLPARERKFVGSQLLSHRTSNRKPKRNALTPSCLCAFVCMRSVSFPIPIRTRSQGVAVEFEIPRLQLDSERLCATRETQRMKRAKRELPSPKVIYNIIIENSKHPSIVSKTGKLTVLIAAFLIS